ncbi:MAG: hypothetical protein N3C12_00900 [Candidatus Binatia bacterium]|nr:hypothetical protein [Candidatus Binatia bacterium]
MRKQNVAGSSYRFRSWFAPGGRSLCLLGLAGCLLGAWSSPGHAALREPPPLNRDQVRAGLADRAEQMRMRQERHWQRREGAGRYQMSPSGRPIQRVPREPRPVPPPESLP